MNSIESISFTRNIYKDYIISLHVEISEYYIEGYPIVDGLILKYVGKTISIIERD